MLLFFSSIRFTPVRIIFFSKFKAKSLKYIASSGAFSNSVINCLVAKAKEDKLSKSFILTLSSVLEGEISSI